MPTIAPALYSLAVLVVVLAWGSLLQRFFGFKDRNFSDYFSVLTGMLALAAIPAILCFVLGISGNTFSYVAIALCVVAFALSFRGVVAFFARNPAFIAFVLILSSFFGSQTIPGHDSLSLGDAPEYMQLGRNIINGLGYKTNFLLADHYNDGTSTVVREVHNRMPLVPLTLGALGAIIGFKSYLVKMIVVILAGACLNFFAGFLTGGFKKFMLWALPFFFYNQAMIIWGGALEFAVAAYLPALGWLAYRHGEYYGLKGVLATVLVLAGILYGGNGAGALILAVCVFAAFCAFVYSMFAKSKLIGAKAFLLVFLVMPALTFSPWLLRSAGASSGNGIYNVLTYDEVDGFVYCKKALRLIEDDMARLGCNGCLPDGIGVRNAYSLNFVSAYSLLRPGADFEQLKDHANMKEFLATTGLKSEFLSLLFKKSLFSTMGFGVFWMLFELNVAIMYALMLAFCIFVVGIKRTLLFAMIFVVCLVGYLAAIFMISLPLQRMQIPFLVAMWGALTFALIKLREPGVVFKYAICALIAGFSLFMLFEWPAWFEDEHAGVVEAAQWVRENTPADALIYVDPPQLFTYLTERRSVGTSWSRTFLKFVDVKYAPDYFIINDYRKSQAAYALTRDYAQKNYEVLVESREKKYIIFRRKLESSAP